MKAILAASLLAITAPAWATTYYVSNCADGAVTACVPGNDNNDGTSPLAPKRSTAAASALFNAAQSGDQILFARGGGWTNAHMALRPANAKPELPVVLGAYTPSWCTEGCAKSKPILTELRTHSEGTNDTALVQIDSKDAAGGHVVKDLELRGGKNKTWGVFISETANDVTLQNLTIQDFAIGVHCGEGRLRVQLLDSLITGNTEQGALWGCLDSLIENTTFENNGYKKLLDKDGLPDHGKLHNIYIGLSGVAGQSRGGNITVRGNTLKKNALRDGTCDGVSLVAHGNIDGLLIENNLIYEEPTEKAGLGCYGIAVDAGYGSHESYRNVVIRGNTIVNTPHTAIGCGACTAPVIENNVIVNEAAVGSFLGIVVPDQKHSSEDARSTGTIIRNNSIYVANAKDASGINLGEYAFEKGGANPSGSDVVVTNNLIFMASSVAAGHSCFNVAGLVVTAATIIDHNLCYHEGGDARGNWSKRLGPNYETLANAQDAGFDKHGSNANPRLVAVPSQANQWSMKLQAGSPAIDAGHAAYKARNSYKGYVRTGVPDIGAYEYGVTP